MITKWGVVSTHSRLKAAGNAKVIRQIARDVSTHSRLKAAGDDIVDKLLNPKAFQHTAA